VKISERQQGLEGGLPDAAHAIYRRFARLDRGEESTLADVQGYWAEKSWAFASLEPGAFAKGLGRKLLFLLAGSEYHDVEDVRLQSERLGRLPLVRYRWLIWFGLAGLLLAAWRRRMPWWLWGYWGAGVAGLVFFSVTSRYAMVFLPSVVLFAGFLVRECIRVREWKAGIPVALSLVLAGVPSFAPAVRWDSRVQERVLGAHDHLDRLLGPRGDMSATIASYTAALAYFPFLPSILDTRGIPFEDPEVVVAAARASENLGVTSPPDVYLQAVLWQDAGDCGRALPLARRAGDAGFFMADYSRSLDPHLLVAECLLTEGDRVGAMDAVLASLDARPATADGLAMAIAGSQVSGGSVADLPGWEERLSRIHDPLSADLALVRSYARWGDTDQALQIARRLQDRLRGSAVVDYQAATLLADVGHAAEAFAALQRARLAFPGLALRLAPFGNTMDEILASEPRNREAWMAKIDRSAQGGRFGEASRVAGEAIDALGPDPEIEQVRQIMDRLAAQVAG
jgi:hypothetical protein